MYGNLDLINDINLFRWSDMPESCQKGQRNSNIHRQNFILKAKVLLRNQNRISDNAKWRDDGLAIDWHLDRNQGTYFAPWPPSVTAESDKAVMEGEVAKQVLAADPDHARRILAVTRIIGGVNISWIRVQHCESEGNMPDEVDTGRLAIIKASKVQHPPAEPNLPTAVRPIDILETTGPFSGPTIKTTAKRISPSRRGLPSSSPVPPTRVSLMVGSCMKYCS
jgi:hypothetical protein